MLPKKYLKSISFSKFTLATKRFEFSEDDNVDYFIGKWWADLFWPSEAFGESKSYMESLDALVWYAQIYDYWYGDWNHDVYGDEIDHFDAQYILTELEFVTQHLGRKEEIHHNIPILIYNIATKDSDPGVYGLHGLFCDVTNALVIRCTNLEQLDETIFHEFLHMFIGNTSEYDKVIYDNGAYELGRFEERIVTLMSVNRKKLQNFDSLEYNVARQPLPRYGQENTDDSPFVQTSISSVKFQGEEKLVEWNDDPHVHDDRTSFNLNFLAKKLGLSKGDLPPAVINLLGSQQNRGTKKQIISKIQKEKRKRK